MLFQPFASPSLQLVNRIVMAPMKRSRAVECWSAFTRAT